MDIKELQEPVAGGESRKEDAFSEHHFQVVNIRLRLLLQQWWPVSVLCDTMLLHKHPRAQERATQQKAIVLFFNWERI